MNFIEVKQFRKKLPKIAFQDAGLDLGELYWVDDEVCFDVYLEIVNRGS